MKAYESDEQEIFNMADGVASEADKIRRLSIRNYYSLMRYVFKSRQEKPVSGNDND